MTDVIDKIKEDITISLDIESAKDLALAEVEKTKNEAIDAIKQFTEETKKNLLEKYNPLKSKLDKAEVNCNTISELLGTAQGAEKSLLDLRLKMETDTSSFPGIIAGFQSKQNEATEEFKILKTAREALNTKIDEINSFHKSTTELYKELFDDIKDEEGKIVKESVNSNIKNLSKKLDESLLAVDKTHGDEKEKFENLRKELSDKILHLLPEAGAASLASTYYEATKRYGYVRGADSGANSGKFLARLRIYLTGSLNTIFNYALFIVPLVLISYIYYEFYLSISAASLAAPTGSGDASVIKEGSGHVEKILLRIAFSTPLAIISIFGFSSIRLNRRLFEEYNHKQRVMQLYESFKEEIQKVGSPEHEKELLTIMCEAVKHKPASIMSKYDGGYKATWFWGLYNRTNSDK